MWTARPVWVSQTVMMSGTIARTAPSSSATRFSFWISEPKDAARVGAEPLDRDGSTDEAAGDAPLDVDDLALDHGTASIVSASDAIGSCGAPSTASPMRIARLTVPRAVAVFAWRTVIWYSEE